MCTEIYSALRREIFCYVMGVVPGTSWIVVVFLCARTLKFLFVLSAAESAGSVKTILSQEQFAFLTSSSPFVGWFTPLHLKDSLRPQWETANAMMLAPRLHMVKDFEDSCAAVCCCVLLRSLRGNEVGRRLVRSVAVVACVPGVRCRQS